MNKKKLLLLLTGYILLNSAVANSNQDDKNKKIPLKKLIATMFISGLMGLGSGYFLTEGYKRTTSITDKLAFPLAAPFILEPLLRLILMDYVIADKPYSVRKGARTYERVQLGNIGWISSWIGFITALLKEYK